MIDTLILVGALSAQAVVPDVSAPSAAAEASPELKRGSSTYVDLEAGAGYSTNSVLRLGGDTASAFGRLSAHAVHTRLSERTSTVISGFAQNTAYARRFGMQQSLNASARHDVRVTERLRLFGDVGAGYDKGGQLDTRIIGVPNVPLTPGTLQPPVLLPTNVDFLSVAGRQYYVRAHFGGQLALSDADFVSASSGVERHVFKGGGFDTRYTTVPFSLGYDRQVSPRTTVGARLAGSFTDYDGPGSIRVLTPQVTVQHVLSERMTFSGALGVAFASSDDGTDTRRSTGLSSDASLCSQGELDQFCARASISQQAATAAGPARSQTVGVDYSRRLSADDTLRLSASANRYSTPRAFLDTVSFSDATYVRAAADYTRRISDRLFGGSTLAARKLTQDGPDPKADLSLALFMRYRLGDQR